MIREEKTTKGWLIIRLTQTKWWAVWWSNGQRSCLLPDDPSSNPAEAYIYYVKIAFEKDKYKQKEAGVGTLKKRISVTRLGYFLKILIQTFLQKYTKCFENINL